MRYPFLLGIQLQSLWLRCAARMVNESMRITQHNAHRRDADGHQSAEPPGKGPDLQDHYGQRAHDVDVERI